MTEELQDDNLDENYAPIDGIDTDEFEEINSEEVDRIVGVIEELLPTIESENVKSLLEEAMNNIYYLVYDEEDEELEDEDGEVLEDEDEEEEEAVLEEDVEELLEDDAVEEVELSEELDLEDDEPLADAA